MKLHPLLLLLAIVPVAAGASGCIAAAAAGAVAGAGAYAYSKGDLDASLQASFDETWEATSEAVSELGLVIRERAKDRFSGRIVASQANGGDVRIRLEPVGDEATRINIRVGTFGDEARSRAILDEINKRL